MMSNHCVKRAIQWPKLSPPEFTDWFHFLKYNLEWQLPEVANFGAPLDDQQFTAFLYLVSGINKGLS